LKRGEFTVWFLFSRKLAAALATSDLLDWLEHIKKTGIAHTTALKNLSHISSFFEYLLCREIIATNPAALIKLKRTASKITDDFLSQEDVALLFQEARKLTGKAGFRDYCILALLYGTGLRANELCSLKMDDVSLGRETVFINHGKRGGQRYIALPSELLPLLKEYKTLRGNKGRTFFHMKGERHVTLKYLRKLMKKLARAAQIVQKVTPKTLRHDAELGINATPVPPISCGPAGLDVVRDLLGHRSISTTQIYIHVTVEELVEAARKYPINQMAVRLQRQANEYAKMAYQGAYL